MFYTPPRFKAVHPSSIEKAHNHWKETHLSWRSEFKVDEMLHRSSLRTQFFVIKEVRFNKERSDSKSITLPSCITKNLPLVASLIAEGSSLFPWF